MEFLQPNPNCHLSYKAYLRQVKSWLGTLGTGNLLTDWFYYANYSCWKTVCLHNNVNKYGLSGVLMCWRGFFKLPCMVGTDGNLGRSRSSWMEMLICGVLSSVWVETSFSWNEHVLQCHFCQNDQWNQTGGGTPQDATSFSSLAIIWMAKDLCTQNSEGEILQKAFFLVYIFHTNQYEAANNGKREGEIWKTLGVHLPPILASSCVCFGEVFNT